MQAVVLRYYQHHAKALRSRDAARAALKAVNTYAEHVTVADFGLRRQEGVLAALKADGLKPSSVARLWGVIGAALRWAYARQEVTDIPPMVKVRVPETEGQRPLTVGELHALAGECLHEHQRRFLVLSLATAGRPGAVLDLTWDRVDFGTGTIALAVPGVDHGKKRRPRVPMPESVQRYLEAERGVGPVIRWHGRRLADHKRLWAGIAERAGVTVGAYGIRKACATWMRQEGVNEWDVRGMLGHRGAGGVTDRYAHWRPDYMRAAAESLERLIRAVDPPWLRSHFAAVPAEAVQVLEGTGGRAVDRTRDPFHVKVGAVLTDQALEPANDD